MMKISLRGIAKTLLFVAARTYLLIKTLIKTNKKCPHIGRSSSLNFPADLVYLRRQPWPRLLSSVSSVSGRAVDHHITYRDHGLLCS